MAIEMETVNVKATIYMEGGGKFELVAEPVVAEVGKALEKVSMSFADRIARLATLYGEDIDGDHFVVPTRRVSHIWVVLA